MGVLLYLLMITYGLLEVQTQLIHLPQLVKECILLNKSGKWHPHYYIHEVGVLALHLKIQNAFTLEEGL